jgi:DNA repair protein RecO (recombination protein O)
MELRTISYCSNFLKNGLFPPSPLLDEIMSSEKTDAILLKVVAWSETSCIVTMFTRDFGRLSVMVKGARRPKSPFEAAIDLLTQCQIVFIQKSGDTLDLLTEAKLVRRFRSAPNALTRLYVGYYMAEYLQLATEPNEPLPELYELTAVTLEQLSIPPGEPTDVTDSVEGAPRSVLQPTDSLLLRFELQSLRILGHVPSLQNCAACSRPILDRDQLAFGLLAGGLLCQKCQFGQRQLIRISGLSAQVMLEASQVDWQRRAIVDIPRQSRAEIRAVMNRYITNLFDRQMRMLEYLQSP